MILLRYNRIPHACDFTNDSFHAICHTIIIKCDSITSPLYLLLRAMCRIRQWDLDRLEDFTYTRPLEQQSMNGYLNQLRTRLQPVAGTTPDEQEILQEFDDLKIINIHVAREVISFLKRLQLTSELAFAASIELDLAGDSLGSDYTPIQARLHSFVVRAFYCLRTLVDRSKAAS